MTKSEQRKIIKAKVLTQDRCLFPEMSSTICDALSVLFPYKKGITVLSYLANEDEADPFCFDEEVKRNGGRVAYPVCGKNGQMNFYIPDNSKGLITNIYGIREPDPSESVYVSPDEADVVIVPCLAYGMDMKRLGHGGGYYDRYLKLCPDAKKILISFSFREMENIVTDENDIYMDLIVTEGNLFFNMP